MRITLVSMPWASIETPSLALGILTSRLRETLLDVEVATHFGNIDCAEWIKATVADANFQDYEFFARNSYFKGCGDWVFSSALYGSPAWNVGIFDEQMTGKISPQEYELCRRLHAAAPDFIDAQARTVAAGAPDLVCLTSTVQQNVASLALARRLKELLPDVRCVMGGANCDGEQGAGIHRAFPQIDYVVRGEGERALPELVRGMTDGDLSGIPGLCWRKEGESVANPMTDRLLAPAEIPVPDFDAYFARVASTSVASWFEPRLVLESARGCWWGEKHHCTFCGLNGSAMTFRSKPPEAFTRELEGMARRHKVLDFLVVDNILDMSYVDTAVRDIAASGNDYRIYYEIKSNMKFHQLERLRDAGIVALQPGIESLNATVLRVMDKGVTGAQNVRMLRDAECLGLSVFWSYLYGFPGETAEQYLPVIAQMPRLHHLPPAGGASPVLLERFSPFFDRPELGFAERRPHRQYAMIYDLPETDLLDIAYLFDTPEKGIGADVRQALFAALDAWEEQHSGSILTWEDDGDAVVLTNTRPDFDWDRIELRTPAEVAAFHILDQPRSRPALRAALERKGTPADVDALLDQWRELGLIFTDEDRHIHVATTVENQRLCRIARRTGEVTV